MKIQTFTKNNKDTYVVERLSGCPWLEASNNTIQFKSLGIDGSLHNGAWKNGCWSSCEVVGLLSYGCKHCFNNWVTTGSVTVLRDSGGSLLASLLTS